MRLISIECKQEEKSFLFGRLYCLYWLKRKLGIDQLLNYLGCRIVHHISQLPDCSQFRWEYRFSFYYLNLISLVWWYWLILNDNNLFWRFFSTVDLCWFFSTLPRYSLIFFSWDFIIFAILPPTLLRFPLVEKNCSYKRVIKNSLFLIAVLSLKNSFIILNYYRINKPLEGYFDVLQLRWQEDKSF